MSQINPLAHVVFQSIEIERRNSVEKERQLQRANTLEKDIAAHDDVMEHQVESTEEVQPVGDEAEQEKQRRQRNSHLTHHDSEEDDPGDSHIDVTG